MQRCKSLIAGELNDKTAQVECQAHSKTVKDHQISYVSFCDSLDHFALRAIELYDTMDENERNGFKAYLRQRIEATL